MCITCKLAQAKYYMIDRMSLALSMSHHDCLYTSAQEVNVPVVLYELLGPCGVRLTDAAPRIVSASPELNLQHTCITNLHSGSADPGFCQHCTVV
jgi:hypothetical protein